MDCLPATRRPVSAREIAKSFPKTVCLVAHPVRCGKPGCRCARGERHGSWRLVWRDGGRQRHCYVRAAELDAVRSAIDRRKARERAERIERIRALFELRGLGQWLREMERGTGS